MRDKLFGIVLVVLLTLIGCSKETSEVGYKKQEDSYNHLEIVNIFYTLENDSNKSQKQWLSWEVEIENKSDRKNLIGKIEPIVSDDFKKRITFETKAYVIEPLSKGIHKIKGKIRLNTGEMTKEEIMGFNRLIEAFQIKMGDDDILLKVNNKKIAEDNA